jgi:hypothetical protein
MAIGVVSLARGRPRVELTGFGVELRATLHGARQEALMYGADVAVLVFPDFANPTGGTGRLVVMRDPRQTLFNSSSALRIDNYDAAAPAPPPGGIVVSVLDLPRGMRFGPDDGLGAPVPFPDAAIPVGSACTFCSTDAFRRGGVVFDYRGRARFYKDATLPLSVAGGLLSVTTPALGTPTGLPAQAVLVRAVNGTLRSYGRR